MEIEPFSPNDKVQLVKGEHCWAMTFYDPRAKMRRLILVRKPSEQVSLTFQYKYWVWNGSTEKPHLIDGCMVFSNETDDDDADDCVAYGMDGKNPDEHIFMRHGQLEYVNMHSGNKEIVPMVPIKDWPPLRKPVDNE